MSLGVLVVETVVLFILFRYIRKLEKHTRKLDTHIEQLCDISRRKDGRSEKDVSK